MDNTPDFDTLAPWLRLLHIYGLGPRTIHRLIQHLGSADAIWNAPLEKWRTLKIPSAIFSAVQEVKDSPAFEKKIKSDWDWIQKNPAQHHIITWADPRYPALLKEIANPPILLFVWGDPKHLADPQIAMVGSRHPSRLGQDNAFAFGQALSMSGLTLTSGLALGIDKQAHEAALQSNGPTVAVLGTGFDHLYPKNHQALAHRIVEQGALISEFPRHTTPAAQHFPQRNRIISGLSWGVLVVEAALQSGSLITARCAMEQNRDVFAIPGSIHHPLAKGCHHLITQGAKLVENVDDILNEWPHHLPTHARMGPLRQASSPIRPSRLVPTPSPHGWLLDLLEEIPTPLDRLMAKSGQGAETLAPLLLELELSESIALLPGGYVKTIASAK